MVFHVADCRIAKSHFYNIIIVGKIKERSLDNEVKVDQRKKKRFLVNNIHVPFFFLIFTIDIIARAGERAISRAQYDMDFVSCVIRSQTLIYDVTFTRFHKRRIRGRPFNS